MFLATVYEEVEGIETETHPIMFYCGTNVDRAVTEYGTIHKEATPACMVEFSDWDVGSFGGKYPTRVWLRAEADEDVKLTTFISYDGGDWEQADEWTPGKKRTEYHPVPIRRCDHWAIRLSSDGPFTLYAIEQELRVDGPARR